MAAISLLALVTAAEVAAQSPSPPRSPPPEVPDSVTRAMIARGLKIIDRAMCGGLNFCAPAAPEEYEFPPITLGQARVAIHSGTQSAVARWCGLDADLRSTAPTMRLVRQKFKLNERQAALFAIIHGLQQRMVGDHLKTRGECDAATRSRLDAELPKS